MKKPRHLTENMKDRGLNRRQFLTYSAVGAGAIVAACTPAAPATTPAPAPKAPAAPAAKTAPAPKAVRELATHFNFGAQTINDSVDPHGTLSNSGYLAIRQTYDALLTFDDAGEKIVGQLASDWKMVNDTTMELTLRDDVKFSNGEDFTADVVKWNFERIAATSDPLLARRKGWFFPDQAWPEVEVVNSTTVRIILPRPLAVFPNRMTGIFMGEPKFLTENADGPNEAVVDKAVGTGSFKVAKFESQSRIDYEAWDGSWRAENSLETATIHRIPEGAALAAALETGELDAGFFSGSYGLLSGLPDNITVARGSAGSATIAMVIGGGKFPVVADRKVRQALAYAVDAPRMLATIFEGFGTATTGQLGQPGMLGYNEDLEAYPYDPDKAKALIKEAGVEGEEANIVAVISTSNWAEALASFWAEAGLKSSVRVVEFPAFVPMLVLKASENPMITSRTDYFSVRDVDPGYSGMATNPLRDPRMNSPEFDETFAKSQVEIDPDKRATLLKKVAEIFHEEVPAVPLIWQDFAYPHTNRIEKLPIMWDTAVYFDHIEMEKA